jgi:hypothetical protein
MASALGKMDVATLLKLRGSVENQLAAMRDTLTRQLASLGIGSAKKRGRPTGDGKRAHALKGTKRPAKYRDPESGHMGGRRYDAAMVEGL